MRILFYVEPYPVRNSMLHFLDVAKKAALLIKNNVHFDLRIFSNGETLDQLSSVTGLIEEKFLIRPTREEAQIFKGHELDWDELGAAHWQDLMQGTGLASVYEDILDDLWNRFPFEAIIHWGENGAIEALCRKKPVVKLAMELGCTREPFLESYVLDLLGTNGAASISKITMEQLASIVGNESMSASYALMAYSSSLDSLGYERQFEAFDSELSSMLLKTRKKVAFLPLQLYDDANLLRFSSYKTVLEVVRDVVPKLIDAGYFVIVKPHPSAKHRINAKLENLAARASVSFTSDELYWCDTERGDFSNPRLLAVSDLVVTVNSSVGFEALYYDKTVVVLGDAIYKPKNLFPTLDDAVTGNFDKGAYLEKIGILRKFFLEAYLIPENIVKDSALFYNRLCTMIGIWKSGLRTPYEICEALYASVRHGQSSHYESAMVYGISEAGVNDYSLPTVNVVKTASSAEKLGDSPFFELGLAREKKIFEKLRSISGLERSDDIAAWLNECWAVIGKKAQILTLLELFDAEHYLRSNPDVESSGIDPLTHFCMFGEVEGRSPMSIISHGYKASFEKAKSRPALLSMLSELCMHLEKNQDSSIFHFSLEEKEAIETKDRLIKESGFSKACYAVVAHLYYFDLLDELFCCVDNIDMECDLIFTLPLWGSDKIEKKAKARYPKALILRYPNRGRDIGPFIDLIPHLIDRNYVAVLKIQTKKGYYEAGKLRVDMGDAWRELALSHLAGTPRVIEEVARCFERYSTLNMIGPAPLLVSLEKYPMTGHEVLVDKLVGESRSNLNFFAGTMFWVRPQCLKHLVDHLDLSSFAPETGENDGNIAHVIERAFGCLGMAHGGVIGAIKVNDVRFNVILNPTAISGTIHGQLEDYVGAQKKRLPSSRQLIW